jgi:hypothetical protein
MAESLFHLVPEIREAEKYFDVSLDDIESEIFKNGEFDLECEQSLKLRDGTTKFYNLRLNIKCNPKYPESWATALKLHATRIDGIDWEAKFTVVQGDDAKGWHRHEWNVAEQHALQKTQIKGFDNANTTRDFILRALKVFRVRLNAASAYASGYLQFN